MIERPRRVVLLIDYDNLQICASRDTPGRDLQLPPVVQLAQHYGTVIMARAYAEWNLSTERLAVYKAGIEPAFAPVLRTESDRSGKSLADTVMVAEGMDMLWTLSPDVVVLATSDKDLIPLVRVAKQRGAFVVVLGSDFTAIPLREMADEHVTYKQLITDAQGRYVTEAGPARQPAALPEPARRRPIRERNGRERTLITPAVATPPVGATPPPARIEREPQATSAPAQGSSVSPASGEPVAPLGVGTFGEGDAQSLGRRRRRRGSRRRSERPGLPGEGTPSLESESEAEDSFSEGSFSEDPLAEGPLAEDSFSEAPLAEGLFSEDPLSEGLFAEGSFSEALDAAELDELVAAVEPSTTIEVPVSVPLEPDPQITGSPAPVTRNRRRTARRPSSSLTTAEPVAAPADEPAVTLPLASAPQTADILWAAEPVQANGTPPPANGTPASNNAEPDLAGGEPIPEEGSPRPRSRRITSGARGRTRPATSR